MPHHDSWRTWQRCHPIDLFGPIVDKELRIASRHKTHYALRTLYVAVLTVSLAGVWFSTVGLGPVTAGAHQVAAMARAGRTTVFLITAIQFFALPVVAAVLLSNSISEEIERGTLAVLLTTPIRSLQIVAGKLVGRLMLLVLLVAISLPLLAIVRVFGGVPWGFIVTGVCLTFSTAVFAGSLSLLASTWLPRAHQSAVVALAVLVLLGLLTAVQARLAPGPIASPGLSHLWVTAALLSPYTVFLQNGGTLNPGLGTGSGAPWVAHCLLTLAVSIVLCLLAAVWLRRAMLVEAFGGRRRFLAGWFGRNARHRFVEQRDVRRLRGPCMFWKDTQHIRPRPWLEPAMVAVVAATFYVAAWLVPPSLASRQVHAALAGIIVFVGLMRTAVLAAGACATEREKRCWPVLLTTLLDERQIVRQKALAILTATLPLWIWLVLHTSVFAAIDVLDPVALVGVAVFVPTGLLLFLGLGMYFGLRATTVTRAVAMTFAVVVGLCFVLPMAAVANPVVGVILSFLIDGRDVYGRLGQLLFMLMFVGPVLVVDVFLGAGFLWQAECQIRRHVFARSGSDGIGD